MIQAAGNSVGLFVGSLWISDTYVLFSRHLPSWFSATNMPSPAASRLSIAQISQSRMRTSQVTDTTNYWVLFEMPFTALDSWLRVMCVRVNKAVSITSESDRGRGLGGLPFSPHGTLPPALFTSAAVTVQFYCRKLFKHGCTVGWINTCTAPAQSSIWLGCTANNQLEQAPVRCHGNCMW